MNPIWISSDGPSQVGKAHAPRRPSHTGTASLGQAHSLAVCLAPPAWPARSEGGSLPQRTRSSAWAWGRAVGWLGTVAAGVLLAACQSKPPQPDWQINAKSASERLIHAQLSAHTRTAQAELALARSEIASTGRIDLAARLELLACALQVASVDFADCPAFERLARDAAPPELAYAAHLQAKPLSAPHRALLPAEQQSAAQQLAAVTAPAHGVSKDEAPVARHSGVELEGSMDAYPPKNGRKNKDTAWNVGMDTPDEALSRLVAAGVLMRAGLATPEVVEQAVQTASHQGWRRPLLAWLGVQAKWAEAAGQIEQAQGIRRRMQLVAPIDSPPASAAPAGP